MKTRQLDQRMQQADTENVFVQISDGVPPPPRRPKAGLWTK